MDNRYEDYVLARRAADSSDPELSFLGKRTIQMLDAETPEIKHMREALVDAHRRGDKDEIKNIHWDVNTHPTKYKNQLANNKLKNTRGETAPKLNNDRYHV
jgi:hypothetical protein